MVGLTSLDRRAVKEAQYLQRLITHPKPELVNAARSMLFLCKAADLTVEHLYAGPALERALWRYEALWLPLLCALSPAHSQPSIQYLHSPRFAQTVEEIQLKNFVKGGLAVRRDQLVPPIDIAWVWHCHRLNPHMYARDIASLSSAGIPLDTTVQDAFLFSDGEDLQSKPLRNLWELVYPFEPYMPRYLRSHSLQDDMRDKRKHITTYNNERMRSSFRSVINVSRIARIAAHQRIFLWQVVSNPNEPGREALIETNDYLNRAFDRYLLFIALHKHAPNELLVPMNDINIIWHAHLSCSQEYKQDCMALLGFVLPHDTVTAEDHRIRRLSSFRQLSRIEATVTPPAHATTDTAADVRVADVSDVPASDRAGADAVSPSAMTANPTPAAANGFVNEPPSSDPSVGGDVDEALTDNDIVNLGISPVELAELDDKEREELFEKRKRVVSVRETRSHWEQQYGSNPRYDLPDTLYCGEPPGERGGFYDTFVKQYGKSRDLSWPVAFLFMVVSCVIGCFGISIICWAFVRGMISHGKYLFGMPVGLTVVALGVQCFLAVPVNRPLSSEARYWRDRNLKQTHNPLPPFLVSSTKHT